MKQLPCQRRYLLSVSTSLNEGIWPLMQPCEQPIKQQWKRFTCLMILQKMQSSERCEWVDMVRVEEEDKDRWNKTRWEFSKASIVCACVKSLWVWVKIHSWVWIFKWLSLHKIKSYESSYAPPVGSKPSSKDVCWAISLGMASVGRLSIISDGIRLVRLVMDDKSGIFYIQEKKHKHHTHQGTTTTTTLTASSHGNVAWFEIVGEILMPIISSVGTIS